MRAIQRPCAAVIKLNTNKTNKCNNPSQKCLNVTAGNIPVTRHTAFLVLLGCCWLLDRIVGSRCCLYSSRWIYCFIRGTLLSSPRSTIKCDHFYSCLAACCRTRGWHHKICRYRAPLHLIM